MYAFEPRCGQFLLQVFQTHDAHDGFSILNKYLHIVLDPFSIEQLVEGNLYQSVAAFHVDKSSLRGSFVLCERIRLIHRGRLIEPNQCLVDTLEKLIIVDGLLQIVQCVDTESLYGIFAEGCGKDYACDSGYHMAKLESIQVGHLNVQEDHIHGV